METTLFARYKSMINGLLADGQTNYTANQLNMHVGFYEHTSHWKRWNKVPYYTTRSYQTILKKLGCITKIKRGLWKINGPIPQWFSTLQLNALTNRGQLQELEKSSIVWQSLPVKHKINPWELNEDRFVPWRSFLPNEKNAKVDINPYGGEYARIKYPANVEGSKEFFAAQLNSNIAVTCVMVTVKVPANHSLLRIACTVDVDLCVMRNLEGHLMADRLACTIPGVDAMDNLVTALGGKDISNQWFETAEKLVFADQAINSIIEDSAPF